MQFEVGNVRLGKYEAGAQTYIGSTECIDILVVQVHLSRGTLIIKLLVGEPDLIVRRIIVPIDIHANPERTRGLGSLKLGNEGFARLAILHISNSRSTGILA